MYEVLYTVRVCDLLRLTIVVLLVFSQDRNTPLHDSAFMGHLDCVQFLVLKGADITQRNNVSGMIWCTCSYLYHT